MKPLPAAGRSVASMSAVAFCQSAAVGISGWRITALICRSPRPPQASAKRIEDARGGWARAMAQPGKISPSALLGQQRGQQVERRDRRQERPQRHAPEWGRTELPTRAANGACVPMFVDEGVGNGGIEPVEQLVGAGHRQAVHGSSGYRFCNLPSGFCFNLQFFAR